jgi:tetratricopeptide (TPR) repeat protein
MGNNNFDENRVYFIREASVLLESNNLIEAINLAAERLQNYPADVDAIGVYCEALIRMGRLEEVRSLLNEVAEIISGYNIIYERAGDVCRDYGFYQEAAACYEKFISLRPDAERSRDVISKMSFLEQEDRPVAETDSTDHNAPEQNFYTLTMAQLYIKQGHVQDAEKVLETIIKNEPYNTQALTLLENLRESHSEQSAMQSRFIKNDHVIQILSSWLKNIERLKFDAAEQ